MLICGALFDVHHAGATRYMQENGLVPIMLFSAIVC
jgi:hypothetical protein